MSALPRLLYSTKKSFAIRPYFKIENLSYILTNCGTTGNFVIRTKAKGRHTGVVNTKPNKPLLVKAIQRTNK